MSAVCLQTIGILLSSCQQTSEWQAHCGQLIIGEVLRPDDIRQIFRQHMGENAEPLLSAFGDFFSRMERVDLPETGQTAAIALTSPKTAALCYDRVWSGLREDIPAGIGFRGHSAAESGLLFLVALTKALQALGSSASRLYLEAGQRLIEALGYDSVPDEQAMDRLSRKLAEGFANEYRIATTTIFREPRDRDLAYGEGAREAIVAVIQDVPVVAEEELTWEQVAEFRRDAEMLRSFRKLVHWLDSSLVGKSHGFICDEIAVRLDHYDVAIRKHGLRTKLGILSAVLDRKAVLTASAATIAGGYVREPLAGLLLGAAVIAGEVVLRTVTAKLDYDDATASAAGEIAYLVELRERISGR